jgi:Ca2+-transporting ATPase
MVILMFFGQYMFFDKPFDIISTPLRNEGSPTDRLVLNTLLFYTFILMNLFNQFNCRILEDHKYNIFSGLYKSYFFVIVLAFEFFLSWGMTDIGATALGSALIGTTDIPWNMHLYCWLQGASVLLINILIK